MIYAKELLCDVLSDNTYCTCICSVKSMPKEVLMHNIALKVSLHVPCPKDKWRNLERGGAGDRGLAEYEGEDRGRGGALVSAGG